MTLIQASARAIPLADETMQCVVTSPPYWGLRKYAGEQRETWTDGWYGALGLEPTPDLFVAHLVEAFREVRRVLRKDGTLWLNLGDSYATQGGAGAQGATGRRASRTFTAEGTSAKGVPDGLKPKDLVGIPWMVAFALRADGWYLRSDIIWHKPNPMPESVTDRPTRAHEYLFLFSKSPRYYYDARAIKEGLAASSIARISQPNFDQQTGGEKDYGPNSNRSMRKTLENFKRKTDKQSGHGPRHAGFNDRWDSMTKEEQSALGRNKRDVWTIPTRPYKGAHFATFPPALVEPCVLAGSRVGDTVFDPFCGSGTTGYVAALHGREFVGTDISAEYLDLARTRIATPLKPTKARKPKPVPVSQSRMPI